MTAMTATITHQTSTAPARSTSRKVTWPLAGAAAGVLGYLASMATMPDITEEQRTAGVSVVDHLTSGRYHLGAVLGFAAIVCLLVFTAGFRRFARRVVPDNLAASVAGIAMVASAGAMILGYGIKGSLSVYLDGGINQNSYPAEGLYSLFMFDDLAPFMSWFGVAVAAGAVAWLALRDKVLPTWLGVVSGLVFLAPAGMLALTGLTGFAGLVGPVWLVIAGIGLTVRFTRRGEI
jgi:hypothetical protein